MHSDLERIGHFSCSDDLLNQLHSNVVWGLRGNFVDVPTDCPQRDERLGWTGDLAVFAPTAAFLYDVQSFLQDWLLDLAVEQDRAGRAGPVRRSGRASSTSTRRTTGSLTRARPSGATPRCGCRGRCGRRTATGRSSTPATRRWSAHVRRVASIVSPSGLWDHGFQFGDWLDPDAPPDQPWKAKADRGVVATACLYRSATMVADDGADHRTRRRRRRVRRARGAHASGVQRALRRRRRHDHAATRSPSTRSPSCSACSTPSPRIGQGSGWRNSSPPTATASRPASPAPRSSPTR